MRYEYPFSSSTRCRKILLKGVVSILMREKLSNGVIIKCGIWIEFNKPYKDIGVFYTGFLKSKLSIYL